jgi:CotS family spore coat protein
MENRFSYKEWLSKYNLDIKFFDNYDFLVIDVIPLRKVFVLVTDQGNKILKKIDYAKEDLYFIVYGIDYLINNGFDRIMNFYRNNMGHITTAWKESTYVVMDLIEGRECEYNNPLDINIAINSLSDMHKASRKIGFCEDYHRFRGFKLIDSYKEKLDDLEKMKTIALNYKNKNEFQEIFLSHVDYFLVRMQKSIEVLEGSPYMCLCKEKENLILCHHDLAYHNILIKDNKGYFIDFDYSIIDLRVHDICNFINKTTKHSCYDFTVLDKIIKEYNKEMPLSKEEYQVLYGMLLFPEGFYSIARDYFYRKKLWKYDSYLYKIQKRVQDIEERQEMVEIFKNVYVLAIP